VSDANVILIVVPDYITFFGPNMSVGNMQELFIDQLKDLYSAERQITRALPKLAKAATSGELK